METKLYRHVTDGGAEYLCSSKVKGTKNEGSFDSDFIVRLDGRPELYFKNPLYSAAPELLEAASELLSRLDNITTEDFGRGGEKAEREALRAAIAKATGKDTNP